MSNEGPDLLKSRVSSADGDREADHLLRRRECLVGAAVQGFVISSCKKAKLMIPKNMFRGQFF
jgi:hypothetical protein